MRRPNCLRPKTRPDRPGLEFGGTCNSPHRRPLYLRRQICCAAPQTHHAMNRLSAARRFRQPRTPAIVHPVPEQTQEETVRQKPSRLARGANMKRCAKDFIRTLGLSGLIIAAASVSALAQKKYDTGVTDTEIKIGNIMPYSGPASAYGIIGKTMSAYFRMINDNGGVNGRKINFISYDDAYSPPKTVEQARKLVESDEVFLIFAPLGTASNAAIQKYMNTMKVPQLFVATGASRWRDPEHFPWTTGSPPNYRAEARIYATS